MAGTVEARLVERGITLPEPLNPSANYVPYVISGNQVYVAGQVSRIAGGETYVGRLGDGLEMERAYAAARACGLNLVAQVKAACAGDLDRVVRVVKLLVFVNAVPDFAQQPQVANGVSDLMVEVFGDAGRHARSAIGAGSLPLGVAVEAEGIFEIAP